MEKVRFLLGWSASISLGTATKNHWHVQRNVILSLYIYVYISGGTDASPRGYERFRFYIAVTAAIVARSRRKKWLEDPHREEVSRHRGVGSLVCYPCRHATVICTRFLRRFLTWLPPLFRGSLPARYRVEREWESGTNWAASFGTSSVKFVSEMAVLGWM